MKRFFFSLLIALTAVVFSPFNVVTAAPDTESSVVAPININTADVQELTELKGIGESKAQAIIAWRDENGPFESVEQLLQVSGVGEATLNTIRHQISL